MQDVQAQLRCCRAEKAEFDLIGDRELGARYLGLVREFYGSPDCNLHSDAEFLVQSPPASEVCPNQQLPLREPHTLSISQKAGLCVGEGSLGVQERCHGHAVCSARPWVSANALRSCLCSQAYADYMGFILTLNEGVRGKKLTCEYKVSEVGEESGSPYFSFSALFFWLYSA